MNPLSWDAPIVMVVAGLFVIVMCRANATYWVGRGLSSGVGRTRLAGMLRSPGYRRAARLLDRFGAPLVAACFLTVGMQTMVLLAAGFTKMRMSRYLPAVIIGCIAWALLYGTVGFIGFRALAALYRFSPGLTAAAVMAAAAAAVTAILVDRRTSRPAVAD